MTDLTTVVYTALIVFGIIGLTEVGLRGTTSADEIRPMMRYKSSGAVKILNIN